MQPRPHPFFKGKALGTRLQQMTKKTTKIQEKLYLQDLYGNSGYN